MIRQFNLDYIAMNSEDSNIIQLTFSSTNLQNILKLHLKKDFW